MSILKNMSTVLINFVIVLIFIVLFIVSDKAFTSNEELKIVVQAVGGLLTIILTAIVSFYSFKKQMPITENKERRMKVFDFMVKNYLEFIELSVSKLESLCEPDESLEKNKLADIEALRNCLYVKIYPFIEDKTFQEIQNNLLELSKFTTGYEQQDQKLKIRSSILNIIHVLKRELNLIIESRVFHKETLDKTDTIFEEFKNNINSNISKLSYSDNDKDSTYWHFALLDTVTGRTDLENNYLRLWDGETESGWRTELIQKIEKDDIIFVYSRGWGYIAIVKALAKATVIITGDKEKEGKITIESLVTLNNEEAISRDEVRLKTIQRIYNKESLKNTLLVNFIRKCKELNSKEVEVKNIERIIESLTGDSKNKV